GETRPAVDGEPSTGECKVEPAGNKEMQEEGGECRGEKHERLGGELRLREPGMKQEQVESHKKEKAGEIVALIERQGTKRHPIAKQQNHGERDAGEFEKEAREGWKRIGSRLCGGVAAEGFAEKRAGKEHDAAKAKEAAKNIGAGRDGGAAGKMEDVRGPVLDFCGNDGREEHADVGVSGDRGEFDGRIGARSGEIGGVLDQAREFILGDE